MTVSAVRYTSPSGEIRIGRLDGDQITDAGPDGPRGFVPDAAGWAAIDGASGAAARGRRRHDPRLVRADEDPLHRAQLP